MSFYKACAAHCPCLIVCKDNGSGGAEGAGGGGAGV